LLCVQPCEEIHWGREEFEFSMRQPARVASKEPNETRLVFMRV
jgi:hypothetical protein